MRIGRICLGRNTDGWESVGPVVAAVVPLVATVAAAVVAVVASQGAQLALSKAGLGTRHPGVVNVRCNADVTFFKCNAYIKCTVFS